ncbi:MAG TPA: FUSC family protein [Trebonia sp.]|jgi:hypothetical protein|nr:FUSC family protein [Trebonia sp.]
MRLLHLPALAPRRSLRPAHLPELACLTQSACKAAWDRARQLPNAGHRARPTAAYVTRLTTTATVAYLVAMVIPGTTDRPVLAPLTALLVLQASVYQTIRAGLKKVAAVTAGVLMAVCLSALVPYTWWLLAMVIGSALLLGRILRLGDDLLEVPISAMLIFSARTHQVVATGRIVDTVIGTVVGLVGGLLFTRLHTQPAREGVADLARRLADLLGQLAEGLRTVSDLAKATEWLLDQVRALHDEIEQVDDALQQAEESARLNPRTLVMPSDALSAHKVALRTGLERLEHSALYLHGLAWSIIDSARVTSEASPVRCAETRARLADVLSQLSVATRTYGQLMETMPSGDTALESQLAEQLAQTHRKQDQLAVQLEPDAAKHGVGETEWPLRGEILAQVDHMRTGLLVDAVPRQAPVPQRTLQRAASRPAVRRPADRRSADHRPASPRSRLPRYGRTASGTTVQIPPRIGCKLPASRISRGV